MKLSDTAIRNAKPRAKPYQMFDGGGLYLEVSPTGGKLWRMAYRFDGKPKRLSFGPYPGVSLIEAREEREKAKKMLREGKNPGAVKKTAKAALVEQETAQETARIAAIENRFDAVARRWFDIWRHKVTPAVATRQWSNLERHVFPDLGGLLVSEIKRKTVKDALRKIEDRGVGNTVLKAKTAITQILTHAVDEESLIEHNPVSNMPFELKNGQTRSMAALTDPADVGALLYAIDGYQGQPEVMAALKLAPLFFVRIGELRTAKWADVDLDRAEWRYIVSKTKTEHLVPLSRQAVEILRNLHALTGGGALVFPGLVKNRPISSNTINAALRRMGYNTQTEMTGHGFRAMARTLLAERLRYPPEVIEHQLAHSVPDTLGTAYNRTKFIDDRRRMMQDWADYLDQLKAGAKVIPLRA